MAEEEGRRGAADEYYCWWWRVLLVLRSTPDPSSACYALLSMSARRREDALRAPASRYKQPKASSWCVMCDTACRYGVRERAKIFGAHDLRVRTTTMYVQQQTTVFVLRSADCEVGSWLCADDAECDIFIASWLLLGCSSTRNNSKVHIDGPRSMSCSYWYYYCCCM